MKVNRRQANPSQFFLLLIFVLYKLIIAYSEGVKTFCFFHINIWSVLFRHLGGIFSNVTSSPSKKCTEAVYRNSYKHCFCCLLIVNVYINVCIITSLIQQWRSQKFVMEGVQNLVGGVSVGGVFLPENFRQNFACPNLIFIARLNNKFMHIANLIGNR